MIVDKVINNNIGQSLYTLNHKCIIPPIIGAGLIAVVASLVGGAINSIRI